MSRISGRNQHSLLGLDRAKTDLNRELGAILAQPEQFHARRRGAHPGIGEKLRPALPGGLTEALRHQHLNLVPQQLFSRIPEQFLDLRINQDDLSHQVHDQHRIRRCFQQTPKPLVRHQPQLGEAKIFLRQPAFGHIPAHTDQPGR